MKIEKESRTELESLGEVFYTYLYEEDPETGYAVPSKMRFLTGKQKAQVLGLVFNVVLN